jgi:fluoroacetyl-CoA thioesterase
MRSLRTIYLVDAVESIRPGLEGRLERVVDGDLITHHVGGAGTFATPAMIGLMEITSHRSIERLLPEGQTSVGYEVHVRHLAPAAPGSTVVVTTRLTEVKGNKLYFDVECLQGDKLIGLGIHKRAVVSADF